MTYMDLICKIARGLQDGDYTLSDDVTPGILDEDREDLLDYVTRMIRGPEQCP